MAPLKRIERINQSGGVVLIPFQAAKCASNPRTIHSALISSLNAGLSSTLTIPETPVLTSGSVTPERITVRGFGKESGQSKLDMQPSTNS